MRLRTVLHDEKTVSVSYVLYLTKLKGLSVEMYPDYALRPVSYLTLGIRRMHQTVEVEKNPVTMGQVAKIAHLVKVEEIED